MISIITMDSHDDNQYKLLIDTVNNNRSDKSFSTSNLNAISECSLYPLTLIPTNNSRLKNLGSARRKCAALFKGITIEEFLEADDDPYSLTAIDKLILKNKAAIAEDQMKRARGGATSKSSTKEATALGSQSVSTASGKKQSTTNGAKKVVKKVLGSKIANKRKTNSEAKKAVAGDKCNGVSRTSGNTGGGKVKATPAVTANKESKKSKSATLPSVPQRKENSKLRNGVDDVNGREQGQSQQRASQQQRSQQQQVPQKSHPQQQMQQKSRQQPSQSSKTQQRASKQQQSGKKRTTDSPRLSARRDMRAKFKQNAKQQSSTKKKSLELGRLNTSLSYQTRSGNKERLRNGKTRIFQEEESSVTLPKTTKRFRKFCDEGACTRPLLLTAPAVAPAPPVSFISTLKRIKQEPIDVAEREVVCEKRRRLTISEIKVEANNNNDGKLEDAPRLKASSAEKAISEQRKTQTSVSCVPAPLVAPPLIAVPPPIIVVPEKPVTVKEEDENLMKEEFSDDFVQEDGADLIDINFITNLLAASDRVSSSCTTKSSSNDDKKSETVLTVSNTQQNGDISKDNLHSNADTTEPVRSLPMAPSNGQSGYKAEVPNTNLFLSEVNNRLNHDNNLAKESMFNALGLQSINKVYQIPKECEVKDKENYTGTLKAIIKVDKGCRRMEMKQKDTNSSSLEVC